MALSKDPVLREKQLANLQPGVNHGPGWRGGIKKGHKFEPRYVGLRCVLCDGEFVAETTKQRFCGERCAAEAARIRAILAGRDPRYVSLAARLGADVQSSSAMGRTLARAEQLRDRLRAA